MLHTKLSRHLNNLCANVFVTFNCKCHPRFAAGNIELYRRVLIKYISGIDIKLANFLTWHFHGIRWIITSCLEM